jgi:hypothetical protein
MKMKWILSLTLCLTLIGNSVGQKIKGTGPQVTKTFDLAPFTTVECSMSADVEITQGSTQKIELIGQENIIDQISKEVKDKKWRIKLPKGMWGDYENLKIKITVPQLHGMGMSGSGSMTTVNTIRTDDFQIGLSGSGKINAQVEAEFIDCGISGSGLVNISGKAKELTIGTSGSGDVRASDLPVERVKIGISGSGDCYINVTESLDAGIAGSGNVRYKGRPRVKTSISGSGSVSTMD